MSQSPALASPRRKILSSVGLALAVLLSMVAFSAPAGAVDELEEATPTDVEIDPICKERYVEYKYERGDHGQQEIREYEYKKQVRERRKLKTSSSWSWTTNWTWWSPASYKWSTSDVAELETGLHAAWNTTWYNYQRIYRYVPTGNSKVIQEGKESTYERTGWVTEAPDGDGWVLIKQRERRRGTECPPPPEEEEQRRIPNCPQGVIEIQSRSAIYVWTGGDKWYVGDEDPWTFDGWTEWSTIGTEPATAEECPPPPPPPPGPFASASVAYECDANGTVTLVSTGGSSAFVVTVNGATVYSENLAGDTTVDFTVADGGSATIVVTANGATIVSQTVDHTACDTPQEETTTTTEDIAVEGIGVEAEEAAGGAGVLPRTGGEAGGFLLLASMLVGLGAILRTASRRLS
jgi:hypothetical protein